jgi:AcrR family transcriptional regulator
LVSRQHRESREQNIIDTACGLIREHGFFNLKMSELAKACGISVGTLYVHFPSKEDLLMGISLHILKIRSAIFGEIFSRGEWNPLHKLMAMIMANHLLTKALHEISEIETLALFPSVWKRASQQSMLMLDTASGELITQIRSNIMKALEGGYISIAPEIEQQHIGVAAIFWGTGMGLHQVFNSYCIQHHENVVDREQQAIVIEAVLTLCKGFDAPNPLSHIEAKQLYLDLQILVQEHIA